MKPDGYQLELFRYILEPRCKLPKNKLLHELFFDTMVPHFGDEQEALQHLWFGLQAINNPNPKMLLPLLTGTLEITDGEILYRKFLAEIVLDLDAEKSKDLIQRVIGSKQIPGISNTSRFMPDEEKSQNNYVFVPYVLKLFGEADNQCIIAPDNLDLLRDWLEKCKLKRLAGRVASFDPSKDFTKECKCVKCTVELGTQQPPPPPPPPK